MTEGNWPGADDEVARWRAVETWQQYGEVTAAWLLGDIQYHPTYGAPTPEPETLARAEELAEVNRLGLVTVDSQAGVKAWPDGATQRAYVEGHCSDEVAGVLMAVLGPTELVCLWAAPGRQGRSQVVVTYDGMTEHTHLGWLGSDSDSIEHLRVHAGEGVARLYGEAWHLQVFDPMWGRDDRLWDSLLVALRAGSGQQ